MPALCQMWVCVLTGTGTTLPLITATSLSSYNSTAPLFVVYYSCSDYLIKLQMQFTIRSNNNEILLVSAPQSTIYHKYSDCHCDHGQVTWISPWFCSCAAFLQHNATIATDNLVGKVDLTFVFSLSAYFKSIMSGVVKHRCLILLA